MHQASVEGGPSFELLRPADVSSCPCVVSFRLLRSRSAPAQAGKYSLQPTRLRLFLLLLLLWPSSAMHAAAAVPTAYSASPSYYDAQPSYSQGAYSFQQSPGSYSQQQLLQQQQSLRGPMPTGNSTLVGQNAHYSLINHHPQQQQQQQASPYRGGMPLQNGMHGNGLMQAQLYQQQQQQSMLQQQQPRPPIRPFARELFPHESIASTSTKQISPPPNAEELSFHERNVRSITESPSPPPEQVAGMLSQILAPEIGNKFIQQQQQQGQQRGGPMPTAHGSPSTGLTLQQQQLYAHFNRPAPASLQQATGAGRPAG